MLSGEVSVWWLVAVVAFALAIVVMSQWLSAHREERRWRRDMAREELRAATERRIAEDRRWGEERLSAYAQFIDIMQQWEIAITEVAFAQEDDEPVDPALIDRMEQLDEQVRPVLARIILLGSPDVQAQCQELVLMYSRGYRDARVGDPILTGDSPGRSVADVLGDAYYGLVDDLRREIGVDPLDDPPVPEPRTAPTSRR